MSVQAIGFGVLEVVQCLAALGVRLPYLVVTELP